LRPGGSILIDIGATKRVNDQSESPVEPDARPARACDAVLIRIAGVQDTLVYWQGIDAVEYEGSDSPPASHGVFLETFANKRILNAGASLHSWSVTWTMPTAPVDCEPLP
jgi:hypothetical protein